MSIMPPGSESNNDSRAAVIKRVRDLTYASDDGSEWEHVHGCEGEPTCPACWAESIRAALGDDVW